jgi:hypothetical protein
MVGGKEQNEVWSAFRVGRRGHVNIIKDKPKEIIAEHDGFAFINTTHKRHFEFSEDTITIIDYLKSDTKDKSAISYLHFYPGVEFSYSKNGIYGLSLQILFKGHNDLLIDSYEKAIGYDHHQQAIKAVIKFREKLETVIKIRNK